MVMRKLLILFTLSILSLAGQAQKKDPVQLSGVVITDDSAAQYVPFAHVSVKSRQRGTMTNGEGFFSFAAMPKDTIAISSIGFKTEKLIVPDTLAGKEYLARIVMQRDTTVLEEVTLYPWPSRKNFKREFLATNVPATKNDIAMRNLAIQTLRDRAEEMGFSPAEIQDYTIKMQEQQIYDYGRDQIYSDGGTAILGRLSDPFAWSRFFKSLKSN